MEVGGIVSGIRGFAKGSTALRNIEFWTRNVAYGWIPSVTALIFGDKTIPHPTYFVCAMVRVKDEGRFLPEWLAYHRDQGIEHVFIYDNGSQDDTISAIGPFVSAGFVTRIEWPSRPISPACERHFLATYAWLSEWIAFIDVDEFIAPRGATRLPEALQSVEESTPAVAMNWRYFGSSGHDSIPSGLVIENFELADAFLDAHVKVIARGAQIVRTRNSHNFYYRWGRRATSMSGRKVTGSFVEPSDSDEFVLNHYVCRGREDYVKKISRGAVDARGEKDRGRRVNRIEEDLEKHNQSFQPVDRQSVAATRNTLVELGYSSTISRRGPSREDDE